MFPNETLALREHVLVNAFRIGETLFQACSNRWGSENSVVRGGYRVVANEQKKGAEDEESHCEGEPRVTCDHDLIKGALSGLFRSF